MTHPQQEAREALAELRRKPEQHWRVGTKVTLNVYCGETPVCRCHSADYAKAIVEAMNNSAKVEALPSLLDCLEQVLGEVCPRCEGRGKLSTAVSTNPPTKDCPACAPRRAATETLVAKLKESLGR